MVNYYKILDIENYSDIDTVRTAYRDKIRRFHPDINKDADASEISKWLNQAKDKLTDPVKKAIYDKQLKLAYLIEISRLHKKVRTRAGSQWRSLSIAERKRRMEESQKLRERDRYLKGLSIFPFYYRLALISLLILSGLIIIYQNYFVTFSGYEHLYLLLGFFLFISGLILISNQTYQYFWIRSLDFAIRFNYEHWIGRFLVLAFFLGPLSIYGLNEYRKVYHLENHFEYGLADIKHASSGPDHVVFSFMVDNHQYVKRVSVDSKDLIILPDGKLLIKYAIIDPRISDVVHEKEKDKLNKGR